jgi:hypothetical protein
MRLMKNVAAALAFSALTAVAAQAEEGTKINCADTDMQLEAQDFEFSCKDFSDPSAVSNAGKLGVELLEAISEKQEQYIAVWDIRAIGSIYLLRKGFEEDVRSNFSSEELAEWLPARKSPGSSMRNMSTGAAAPAKRNASPSAGR